MTHVLAQRKYRLAGRLATYTAKTLGLGTVLAFAVAAIASVVYRETTGSYEEYAFYVLLLLPIVMVAAAWTHVQRTYPTALANGVTRTEFLSALAIYGLVIVAATVAFTHLGSLVISLGSTFRGVEYHQGFYGMGLWTSIVRPVLYLAVGAAAGALTHRFANRRIGFALGALLVAVVAYRQSWLWATIVRVTPEETMVVLGVEDIEGFATVDAVLAALLILLTWVLLARAPMRPKEA
jgi:hypothetical protein